MKNESGRTINELLNDREVVDQALRKAAYLAILRHAQAGRSIPEMQDGKVVWIPAVEALARLDPRDYDLT